MDTNTLAALRATHELYCQLTGQKLTLRFDRERLWYEFLRAGFSAHQLGAGSNQARFRRAMDAGVQIG